VITATPSRSEVSFFSGPGGDLLGRKRVFMAGIGLFTFASLVGGLAPSAACC